MVGKTWGGLPMRIGSVHSAHFRYLLVVHEPRIYCGRLLTLCTWLAALIIMGGELVWLDNHYDMYDLLVLI